MTILYDTSTEVDTAEAEAQVEAENAGAMVGAAWIKRRGKASPGEAYVVMDGETFTHLLREAGY